MSARRCRMTAALLLRRWQQLEGQLERNRAALLEQGSIVKKHIGDRTYWCVRYFALTSDHRRVQRSIHVGRHPYLLHRVRGWLEALRAERLDLTETLELARLARRLAKRVKLRRQARSR